MAAGLQTLPWFIDKRTDAGSRMKMCGIDYYFKTHTPLLSCLSLHPLGLFEGLTRGMHGDSPT